MADGSDGPDDLVRYQRLLEEGYDCAFGSRFMPGGKIPKHSDRSPGPLYPAVKQPI